jgi:hypothetical protein
LGWDFWLNEYLDCRPSHGGLAKGGLSPQPLGQNHGSKPRWIDCCRAFGRAEAINGTGRARF